VIVDKSDVLGGPVDPTKDDAPLLVDADAVEPPPAPAKSLQPVPWGRSKIQEGACSIEHVELPESPDDDVVRERSRPTRSRTVIEIRGGLVAERGDH
jgi:hypothetical protein